MGILGLAWNSAGTLMGSMSFVVIFSGVFWFFLWDLARVRDIVQNLVGNYVARVM